MTNKTVRESCSRCNTSEYLSQDGLCLECHFREVERFTAWSRAGCTVPRRELDDATDFEDYL